MRRGLAWSGVASATLGVLDVVATLLLLRQFLSPAEYGVAALATTLFPMLDLLADAGIGAAIVQRPRLDHAALTSAWWAALAISAAIAAGLAVVGPGLASLHGQPVVGGLLAAYGARLVVQNAATIPIALLRRELRFRALAIIKIVAAIAEFAGKIIAAAAGLGVWCFVIAAFAKVVAQIVTAQLAQPFWPRGRPRRAEAAPFLRFGGRISASQVLFHAYSNLDYQIVAYVFGAAATGLYRAAYELVLEPAKILSYVVVDVAFPVYCRLRGDRAALRAQLIAFTRQNLLVLLPVLSVMAVVPGELLELVFGAAWRPAGDAVRLLCIVGGLRALSFLLPPLLDGVGRADLTLRYTICAAILVPAAQLAAALGLGDALGWRAVALAWVIAYPIAFAVLVGLVLAEIDLSPRTYLRGVRDALIAGSAGLASGALIAAALPAWPAAARVAVVAAAVVVAQVLALRGAIAPPAPPTS